MTWGEQNSEQEAFQQLDYAMEQGINFIDAAENVSSATQGRNPGPDRAVSGQLAGPPWPA